jgi:hypothetical protein
MSPADEGHETCAAHRAGPEAPDDGESSVSECGLPTDESKSKASTNRQPSPEKAADNGVCSVFGCGVPVFDCYRRCVVPHRPGYKNPENMRNMVSAAARSRHSRMSLESTKQRRRGCCRLCDQPSHPGYSLCAKHRSTSLLHVRVQRAKCKAKPPGICQQNYTCTNPIDTARSTRVCAEHFDQRRDYILRQMVTKPPGVCKVTIRCTNPIHTARSRTVCVEHFARKRASGKRWQEEKLSKQRPSSFTAEPGAELCEKQRSPGVEESITTGLSTMRRDSLGTQGVLEQEGKRVDEVEVEDEDDDDQSVVFVGADSITANSDMSGDGCDGGNGSHQPLDPVSQMAAETMCMLQSMHISFEAVEALSGLTDGKGTVMPDTRQASGNRSPTPGKLIQGSLKVHELLN